MRNVVVILIGDLDRKIVDSIAHVVREAFNCEIVRREPISAPSKTRNPVRKQYHSTKLLKALEPMRGGSEYLLGIIDQDLYVPELNFVFGQADTIGRIAIIGLPRLRQEFYGFEPDPGLFIRRAEKEAIHELGHTKGLGHCPDTRCVMHFSNSLEDTDRKEAKFCSSCRSRLAELK